MQHFLDKIGHNIFAMKSIFDSIKDLIFLMEKDGDSFRYVYINQSALKVLGFKEAVVGRRIEDVMPKERVDTLISQYHDVVSTQKSLNFEEKIDTIHGEFIGETSLNPISTEKGTCNFVLGIVRDVTDRRRKEKELTETKRHLESNQERLHSLVKHNRDAVFELDLQGNFINMNERTCEITGYEASELINTSFEPLIVGGNIKETNAYFKNALKGKTEEYEVCIQKRNGQQVLLHVKNIPIVVDGIVVGLYGIAKDITEESKLEQLLKESEQRYKSLFENHPDAIFSIDLDGNYTSGNPAAEKISGYSMENLKGKPFWHSVIQEDRDYAFDRFKQVIEQKKPESYHIRMKHGVGHQIDVFVMCIPIFVDNQIVGLYGVSRDITEQKRAQAALVETKEELETFWNYSVDPVFFFSSDGKILKVNPAFEKMFGFSEAEVLENMSLIVPSSMEDDAKGINERIRNGETITYHETKRMTKSGEILDIIASYTPVQNEKGKVVGATSFYKDVTGVKKAEKELQKSEEKFRLITENAFDVIKLVSPSGMVEYVSPANERILGYAYSEYIGKPFTTYIHPDDIPLVEKGFEDILNRKKPSPVETRVLHKKGHWIWLEVTITPIIEDGEVRQLVLISRNITERKRHRDALTKMAFYDYLTGLPNRRTFDDRLEMAIHQANRSKKKVAVMMLDGRKFKQINDTYGHDAGDAVIKELGKRIQQSLRKTDTVSRLGGDEMGVILTELESTEFAEVVAKRILHSLDKPLHFNNNEITLEAGIGIAFYPDHSVDKRQLIKHADEALYIAKKSNQNEYRIYQ